MRRFTLPGGDLSLDESSDGDNELVTDRVPGPIDWLLLTGNRWIIAGGFLFSFFLFLSILLGSGFIATRNGGFLSRLFAGLIGGNFTLIIIVITIN